MEENLVQILYMMGLVYKICEEYLQLNNKNDNTVWKFVNCVPSFYKLDALTSALNACAGHAIF